MKTNLYINDTYVNYVSDHCRESLFTYTRNSISDNSKINKIGISLSSEETISEYYFLEKVMIHKICYEQDLQVNLYNGYNNETINYTFVSPTNGFAKIINSFVKPFILLKDERIKTVVYDSTSFQILLGMLDTKDQIEKYLLTEKKYGGKNVLNSEYTYPINFYCIIKQYLVQTFFDTWIINNPLYFSIVSNLFKIGNSAATFRDILPVPPTFKDEEPLKYINNVLVPYSVELSKTLQQITKELKELDTPLIKFNPAQTYYFNKANIDAMVKALTDDNAVNSFMCNLPVSILSHNGIDNFRRWLNKEGTEF